MPPKKRGQNWGQSPRKEHIPPPISPCQTALSIKATSRRPSRSLVRGKQPPLISLPPPAHAASSVAILPMAIRAMPLRAASSTGATSPAAEATSAAGNPTAVPAASSAEATAPRGCPEAEVIGDSLCSPQPSAGPSAQPRSRRRRSSASDPSPSPRRHSSASPPSRGGLVRDNDNVLRSRPRDLIHK